MMTKPHPQRALLKKKLTNSSIVDNSLRKVKKTVAKERRTTNSTEQKNLSE
jgi:hypothetical protein